MLKKGQAGYSENMVLPSSSAFKIQGRFFALLTTKWTHTHTEVYGELFDDLNSCRCSRTY